MAIPSTREITRLLIAWNKGDAAALEQLKSIVHWSLAEAW